MSQQERLLRTGLTNLTHWKATQFVRTCPAEARVLTHIEVGAEFY